MDSKLLLTDSSALKERQSVRATFRLSAEFIEALRSLSAQLSIKQKSLFDYLLEDTDSLIAIAGKTHSAHPDRKDRVQKTFVISKKSLTSLDRISKESGTSRDDLVEYSIQRLLPILVEERRKQKQREEALAGIAAHFEQANELLDEIKQTLGKDDMIYKNIEAVFATYRSAFGNIVSSVNSGKRITRLTLAKFRR